jgi:hypothetical protein
MVKALCGGRAHRRWYYTGPAGQPSRYVRWYCRSVDAPKSETAANLVRSAWAWITGGKTPWQIEAEEAEEEAAEAGAPDEASDEAKEKKDGSEGGGSKAGSVAAGSSSHTASSAASLRRFKRRLTAMGIVGVYLVWTVFAWFIFTYGMLIYTLIGPSAEQGFTKSWGLSYGVGAAAEWQDIAKEAAKGVVVLAILESLVLTRPVSWLEEVRISHICACAS